MGSGIDRAWQSRCPCCGVMFNLMTKKGGFVIDCSIKEIAYPKGIIRVCLRCDVEYEALEKVEW